MYIIYNTCGISGRENVSYYIEAIESILSQKGDFRVCLSSCLNNQPTRTTLMSHFGRRISYCFIDEILPVNVTFNLAVLKMRARFGPANACYVDSGIKFTADDQIERLLKLHNSGPYGMTAAATDTDSGISRWFFNKEYDDGKDVFKLPETFILPLGRAINLHVQIFDDKLQSFYGRCMPDIFAGYCTESVFSFLCAALNTKWVLSTSIVVKHLIGMDGPSTGFFPPAWKAAGNETWEHPFKVPSVVDICKRGQEFGLGYEELQQIVMHEPEKFDENGYSKDTRLAPYIRDNLFLSKELLDYDMIQWRFM